jgi:hypothetical protein
MWQKLADVSEECTASIFREKRVRRKMEAVRSYENILADHIASHL